MGLWGFVSSAVSSAVSTVSNAVKSVASSVGSAVKTIISNPTDIFMDKPIWREVLDIVINLFKDKKYDSGTASVEETCDINRELAKYAKSFHEEANKVEGQAIAIANDFFDQFLDKLEEIKSTNDLIAGMPIQNIKKEIRDLRNMIQGSIKKEIDQKYSLDNPDLLVILEMDPGESRDRLFQNLSKDIMRQALENLTNKIEEMSEKQGQIISSVLEEQIDQISQTMKTENKLLADIEKSIKLGEEELNKTKANINYTINLCDIAVNGLHSVK